MSNSVSVTLPPEITRDIVQAQIKAAVVAALAKDPTQLVAAVVDAAMREKKNSYDRETIWDARVNEMIREAAEASFREWLAENSETIRQKVRQRLEREKTAFVKKIADSLTDAVKTGFYFTAQLKTNG